MLVRSGVARAPGRPSCRAHAAPDARRSGVTSSLPREVEQLAQRVFGAGRARADDAEIVAAPADLHVQARFEQAQVLIQRAAQIGEPRVVRRLEIEFARSGTGGHDQVPTAHDAVVAVMRKRVRTRAGCLRRLCGLDFGDHDVGEMPDELVRARRNSPSDCSRSCRRARAHPCVAGRSTSTRCTLPTMRVADLRGLARRAAPAGAPGAAASLRAALHPAATRPACRGGGCR